MHFFAAPEACVLYSLTDDYGWTPASSVPYWGTQDYVGPAYVVPYSPTGGYFSLTLHASEAPPDGGIIAGMTEQATKMRVYAAVGDYMRGDNYETSFAQAITITFRATPLGAPCVLPNTGIVTWTQGAVLREIALRAFVNPEPVDVGQILLDHFTIDFDLPFGGCAFAGGPFVGTLEVSFDLQNNDLPGPYFPGNIYAALLVHGIEFFVPVTIPEARRVGNSNPLADDYSATLQQYTNFRSITFVPELLNYTVPATITPSESESESESTTPFSNSQSHQSQSRSHASQSDSSSESKNSLSRSTPPSLRAAAIPGPAARRTRRSPFLHLTSLRVAVFLGPTVRRTRRSRILRRTGARAIRHLSRRAFQSASL